MTQKTKIDGIVIAFDTLSSFVANLMKKRLSSFLNSVSGIEVIGEASDGEAAVRMAREVKPDVILMDIDMPNMDGLEATRIIHSEYPHTRVIGLSMLSAEEKSAQMIAVGASAYCSKDGDTEILLSAIRGEATL
jgi:DNA-binding NarL/FixJ family response regulator